MTTSAQVFQDGGKLKENAFYIERKADRLLYEYLVKGEYCSILDPRQVGKSSLMEQTARRLTQSGVKCGFIDLQSFANADITFEKLINSLIFTICRSLEIENDNLAFLKKYESLSANKVLEQFFREVVFPKINSKVVLFIDEVDIVKSFKDLPEKQTKDNNSNYPWSDKSSIGDSFFLTFRSLHESRTSPPFDRLAVCFAGVAFPADLVSRPEISPFNVGKRVTLSDFSLEEMRGFRKGLAQLGANPDEIIEEVYKWTNGHPYMTQKIFADLAKCDLSGKSVAEVVEERVNQLFLVPNISPDANLAYAVKRLTSPNESEAAKNRRPQILETFSRIKKAEEKKIPLEKNLTDTETPSFDESRLFGLTSFVYEQDRSYLMVRNKIYDKFFSDEWVANAISEQRSFRPFFERWLKHDKSDDYLLRGEALASTLLWAAGREDITKEEREFIDKSQEFNQQQKLTAEQAKRARTFRIAAALSTLFLIFTIFAWFDSYRQRNIAEAKGKEAQDQSKIATFRAQEALEQRKIAENKQREAEELGEIAESKRQEALEQREIAERSEAETKKSEQRAQEQKRLAEKAKGEAEKSAQEALKQRNIAEKEKKEAEEQRLIAENQTKRAEEATLETLRQRRISEQISNVVIRQERSTQPIYNPEQQAAFRNDAERIARDIELQNNQTSLPIVLLPRTFDNWRNQQLSDINSENTDGRLKYAGELIKNNKSKNYYSVENILYNTENPNIYFIDEKGLIEGNKISIPYIWSGIFYRDMIYQNGDLWITDSFDSVSYFDFGKKTFVHAFTEEDFSSLDSIFQAEKDTERVVLISAAGLVDSEPLSSQSMAVFNKKTRSIEKIFKGFYFLNLSRDNFLFQDETGLHQVNINDVEKVSNVALPKVVDSLTANNKASLFIQPLYDKKSGIVAIVKHDLEENGGFVDVFNLSTLKEGSLNYRISEFIVSGSISKLAPGHLHLLIPTATSSVNRYAKNKIQILDLTEEDLNDFERGAVEFDFFINDIIFSGDGTKLAVSENTLLGKGVIHIFDANTFLRTKGVVKANNISHYTPPIQHEAALTSVAFYSSGNKNFIVSGDRAGYVKISRIEKQTITPVQNLKFASSIQEIKITASNDLEIMTEGGTYSHFAFKRDSVLEEIKRVDIKDYSISSSDLKISPTFKDFATFTEKEVRIWNDDGSISRKFEPLEDNIKSLEYSPDGKYLCAVTNSEVIVLNTETGEKTLLISKSELSESNIVKFTSFSNSGQKILVEFNNGYSVYDLNGKLLKSEDFRINKNVGKDDTTTQNTNLSVNYQDENGYFSPLSRFSPGPLEEIVIVSSEVNKNDQSLLGILKDKFEEYFGNPKTRKNLIRFVNLTQGRTVKEFIIDNFKFAKFSPEGNKVALFTLDGQYFIADTRNEEQKDALLLPISGVKSGNFSQSGEKFITSTEEEIYIFNTSDASLSHKSKVPYDEEIISNLKGTGVKPQRQVIDFVKFVENDEIEIGRQFFFSRTRENQVNSNRVMPGNVAITNTSTNFNISIPITTTAKISDKTSEGSVADLGCYRINDNGMLVAKSRCGN